MGRLFRSSRNIRFLLFIMMLLQNVCKCKVMVAVAVVIGKLKVRRIIVDMFYVFDCAFRG